MLHGNDPRWWRCSLGSWCCWWWWWGRSRQWCCSTFWKASLPESPNDDGDADGDNDVAHCSLVNVNETDTFVDLGVDLLAGVCHCVGGTLAHGGDLVVGAVEVKVVDEVGGDLVVSAVEVVEVVDKVGGGGGGKDGEGVEVEV